MKQNNEYEHVHLIIAVFGLYLTSTPPTTWDYSGGNHYKAILLYNTDD